MPPWRSSSSPDCATIPASSCVATPCRGWSMRRRPKSGKTNDAVPKYQAALKSARDVDQVEAIAKELKKLGHPVSLPSVFGWVTNWKVIGPFDSKGGVGFDKVYPPEERTELAAEYDGQIGKVRWQEFKATDDYGKVDLNKPCGMLKGVAGYAYTEFFT